MTSSPTNFKKMSPVQKVDLPKIDKLLDKLQRNISKCQDDDYYEETEKYVSHIEKTSELCSLVWQEIIGTLEMSASAQCIKTLDKLFKVMRLQTMSNMNFGLHYYKQYSEALLNQEKNDSLSPKTNKTFDDLEKESPGKPQGTFESRFHVVNETFDNLEGRGSVQSTSPVNRRQPYHRGGPNYPVFTVNGHVPAGKTMTMAPTLSSQAKSLTNFKYTFGAQLNKTDRDFSPEMLAVSDNRHNQLSSMQEVLENMPTEEQDQNMLKEYYDEHDKMQQQIDEVLKGKTKVANLTPNNVTINLRQVLRNLDSTQKQITQITTDTKNNTFDDDDSDDLEEPNFGEMANKIRNAFLQAKLKAASNIKGVLKSTSNSPALKKKTEPAGKGGKSTHSKNKASKGGAAAAEQILIEKKDIGTNVDELEFIMEEQAAMLGNENNKNQQKTGVDEKEEKNKLLINSLKIKIGQLEKEKSEKGDKYTKLVGDYAQCAQEKRDAWERIKQLEKEIEELKKELLKQKSINESNHHLNHTQSLPMTIAEAKIPIAQTHDHSERSPVTALQYNNLNIDSRGQLYTPKNQEWDNVKGGASSEIFSNSAKHEAHEAHEAHGEIDSSHHNTSNPPSIRHIGPGNTSISGGADNIRSLQEMTPHHNTDKNPSSSSPQKVVKGRIPSKSLHSSTVQSNFKQYQSNHESPMNQHTDYLEAPAITEIANSNESNISENQKRSLERMINEPSYKLEDLPEDFSADVVVPKRPDYVVEDADNNESQQTLSIEERPEATEIIHHPEKVSGDPIFIQSKEEKKEELVNAIRDSISLVAIKAQESEGMENNSSVSLGPGPKSLSQSRLQTPSHLANITSPNQARKKFDVIVKTEIGGSRSKKPSPDRKTNNQSDRSPKNYENKKALSINNFEKAHVKPSNQRSSKLIPTAAVTQAKMATIVSAATEKSQVSETINPGMFSVDEEFNTSRAKKFMNEVNEIDVPVEPKVKHRREKSLADYTPNKLSILQPFDFQEDIAANKIESPAKARTLIKRNTEGGQNRPARITTQQPSNKPLREFGIRSPGENHRSPTENLRRALEEEDNSVSLTSPNLPNLNNSHESNSNNHYHHSATRNTANNSGNTRPLGKSSTYVYLRTADSPTHSKRPKPGVVIQSNSSLVNLNSISKATIKSPTYVQEYVQSKTPSIAKKIWQEVEEVKNFPANGILYKGRSKFPTAVPMTYDSADERGHAESSPNRYMYSTSRGLDDEVIGNTTEGRSFPITISNYSPKNSHLNDFSSGFNTTSDKFVKPKLTIEECLRVEMNKEKESPAHNREDGQVRIMYRSMLAKAKQDPKLIQYIRRLVEIEGEDLSASEHPIVEFSAFARFVKRYTDFHERCGGHCEHIVKFYAKIGYQVFWNKRAPMPIKRAEIGVRSDTGRNSPRFPSIGKKKKEVGKDIYH